jgi:hypothetical protein
MVTYPSANHTKCSQMAGNVQAAFAVMKVFTSPNGEAQKRAALEVGAPVHMGQS